MFWKIVRLWHSLKRRNSTKRSRTRQGTDGIDRRGLLGKRKRGNNHDIDRELPQVNDIDQILELPQVHDIDWISKLPPTLIHEHIFRFIHSTKDIVRTTILSKQWKTIFHSYPVFDFDERLFRLRSRMRKGKRGERGRIRAREVQKNMFKAYVEKSLASRLNSAPSIEKFRLYVDSNHHWWNYGLMLNRHMGDWILAALNKNVKELSIHLNPKSVLYHLPISVLESKSITSLKLSGSLAFGPIKLSLLRELSIKDVLGVTESVIEEIEKSCPLLEDLRLVYCNSLFTLALSYLPKLKRVEIHECRKLSFIKISSSNLETFWYHAKKNQQCKINFNGSGNLKNLTLKDRKMTDAAFQCFILDCPFLENLVLNKCSSLERLTILSGILRSLAIIQCGNLREVDIEAPKMYSFQYSGNNMPFSTMNVEGLREAKISFCPDMEAPRILAEYQRDFGIVDRIAEYQRLFGNFDRSKGFKLIVYTKEIMTIYEEPREAPRGLRDFCKLELISSSTSVIKIVDNWLWECHGKKIELVSPSDGLLKSVHDMIEEREENPNCCAYNSKKCWRHYIKGLKKICTSSTVQRTCYEFEWKSRRGIQAS